MSDIVERLRTAYRRENYAGVLFEAADEIERLNRQANAMRNGHLGAVNKLRKAEAEIERLRAALKPFADYADPSGVFPPTIEVTTGSRFARKQLTMGDCYEAARALEQSGSGK